MEYVLVSVCLCVCVYVVATTYGDMILLDVYVCTCVYYFFLSSWSQQVVATNVVFSRGISAVETAAQQSSAGEPTVHFSRSYSAAVDLGCAEENSDMVHTFISDLRLILILHFLL